MTILFHILVALTYVTLAAVVSFALPKSAAAVEPMLAMVMGGAVFLAGMVAHQFVAQLLRGRRLGQELHTVAAASVSMLKTMEKAQGELRALRRSIGAEPDGSEGEDAPATYKQVLGEVKVLRTLLGQLRPGDGPSAPPQPLASVSADGEEDGVLGYSVEPVPPRTTYRADWAQTAQVVERPAPPGASAEPERPRFSDADILRLTNDALERARVSLFLQPIVRLPTRKTAFYEAFSRIKAEDESFIGPESYIGPAERGGLITAIDNNLLFRCVQLGRRVRRHNKSYPFFCNVSPHTLQDEAFFPQFIDFLAENRELSSDLVFEFRQADVGAHYDAFSESLERLASLGFRFSLDRVDRLDLNYGGLAKRYFRFVKIEAATLVDLVKDAEGAERMTALQDDMHGAGISLIVEKVETERELVELLDHQIELGQGYLFGEPRESMIHG